MKAATLPLYQALPGALSVISQICLQLLMPEMNAGVWSLAGIWALALPHLLDETWPFQVEGGRRRVLWLS